MAIEVGQPAPDFTLRNQHGEEVSLSQYRGDKNVVLMFYPFAFSGNCTNELCDIRDRYVDFVNDDTVVLSVSCDPVFSLKPFAEQEGYTHSLLSDFWPHGAVSQLYGTFNDERGRADRSSFVIDKDGIVRWEIRNGNDVRNSDDYKAALDALA
jgi:mycoredoxin-dependent peroxiredoxin